MRSEPPPAPEDGHPRLVNEVRQLELACKKAELELKLQTARASTAALALENLATEEALRCKKRQAHGNLEKGSAEKQPRLKATAQNMKEDVPADEPVKHDAADEMPKQVAEAPKATSSGTQAAMKQVLTPDVTATGSEPAVEGEEAALDKAASDKAEDSQEEAVLGNETEENEDVQADEINEAGSAAEEDDEDAKINQMEQEGPAVEE